MGKWIATRSILICWVLTPTALALTADDYVIAGRQCLFERTINGLAQARDIFEAGISDGDCPDCGGDRDVMLLDAIAKTALLLIDHNDVLSLDGFFRLAGDFGVPLAEIAFYEPPAGQVHQGREQRLVAAEVDAQTIRQTLRDSVLPALGEAVATLDAIEDWPDPFVMYLAPSETGLANDLEVDYGDVLALKSLLLAYKARLTGQLALQRDGAAGELVVDCNAIVLCDPADAPRPASAPDCIRPEGPVPGMPDDGVAILNRARQDWRRAVTCHLEAVDCIAGENHPPGADPQEDEFVYIDPDTEFRLDELRQTLMGLEDSFLSDTPGGERPLIYGVYDPDAVRLGRLTLISSHLHFEGRAGRLILADGSALEVEWFGLLDEDRVGVSLFAPGGERHGWLEGTVEGGRKVISDGTLDLWPVIDSGPGTQLAEAPANVRASFDATLKWSKMAWAQLREALAPVSGRPFARDSVGRSATP
jgi:hypothetical protein